MKILILTKFFPDLFPTLQFEIVKRIAIDLSKNNEVIVIKPVPVIPSIFYPFIKDGKNYHKHPEHIFDKIPIFYLKYPRLPFSYKYFDDKTIEKVILNFINKNSIKFDIIYSHWPYPDGFAAYNIAKQKGKKFVLHFHAGNPNFFRQHRRINKKVQILLENSDMSIFVSDGIRAKTSNYYNIINSTVIYNGIDSHKFNIINKNLARKKLNLSIDKNIILSVSILKRIKRLDLSIYAFYKIQKTNNNILYYIIGDGEEKKKLQRLIEDLKLKNKVFLVGYKEYSIIPLWMNAANVLVQPSDYESFGQIFVEALLCGTPVIGTNVGGIPEIIKDSENGKLVDTENIQQLVESIFFCLKKEWKRDKLRNSVLIFNSDRMIDSINTLFNNL